MKEDQQYTNDGKDNFQPKNPKSDFVHDYFHNLEALINRIPLTEEGKRYIWFDSFVKIYDSPQLAEDGSITYGIQTEWQLKQFHEQFKKNFETLRLKRIEAYLKEIDNLTKEEALDKLNRDLQWINRKELLNKIGGPELDQWDEFLKDLYQNEIDFRKNITKSILKSENQVNKLNNNINKSIEISEHKPQLTQPETSLSSNLALSSNSQIKDLKFADIFVIQNWEKYILALSKTEPPLLNEKMQFIGKPKKHKGVVCSWLKFLQNKGKIKSMYNRSQLADALNNEILDIKVGKDGKTLDNFSLEFEKNFKSQLINLTE